MPGNPTGEDVDAQRAVVEELIARADPLTRRELFDILRKRNSEAAITAALDSLLAIGVAVADGETVEASAALNRLDEIGLIAV